LVSEFIVIDVHIKNSLGDNTQGGIIMYDLIIVGGGPAALTAAIYAARKEMSFIVIAPELGGEVMNTTFVENYPGLKSITGKNLAMSFADHARQFNFKHIEDAATDVTKHGNVFKVKTYEKEYESKTVIWATGSQYRTLNVPGEAELRSRGITYCSICDGPLFKGKAVAVVGGGNSGLTSVLYMLDISAGDRPETQGRPCAGRKGKKRFENRDNDRHKNHLDKRHKKSRVHHFKQWQEHPCRRCHSEHRQHTNNRANKKAHRIRQVRIYRDRHKQHDKDAWAVCCRRCHKHPV